MTKKKAKLQMNPGKAKLLGNMKGANTFKDAQRQAVVLGMPFADVVNSDWGMLQSYVMKTNNTPDPTLLDKYDEWMDEHIAAIGYPKNDPMRSNRLRLGYLGEDPETGEKRRKRVRGIPKPKVKKAPRERDEHNLIKGTKKSYTFELTAKGYDIERIKRRVLKKFPDANEKSIKLWHTAAKRKIRQEQQNNPK